MNEPKEDKHRFDADRPIEKRDEDLLGRAPFAEAIADAITGWRHKDSLVVALCGPWGSGKSSVKNLVLERIRREGENPALIVEFNPWQWSAGGNIAESFFSQIGAHLGWADRSKEGKKRAQKWQRYALRLGILGVAADPLPGGILRLLIAVGAISASAGSWAVLVADRGCSLPLALASAAVFSAVFVAPKWLAGICQGIGQGLKLEAEAAVKSVEEVKGELAELLRRRPTPLVVAMDDVDRLSSSEIRLLFRLVKANADFPNLVYFLLFQRDIVEKALQQEAPGGGSDYLGKIVQVPFDLPAVERVKLERVLFEGLNRILSEGHIDERFDKRRWDNVYIVGLRGYFQTLRDVRRFLSALSFHTRLFCGDRAFEVNPVDLIALEVLRVFEPSVYAALPAAKGPLTGQRPGLLYDSKAVAERTRALFDGLADAAREPNRGAVRAVVRELFPTAQWASEGSGHSADSEEECYRKLRVCHSQVFDRYFHFAIPEGDVSQSEIDEVIELASDRGRLVARLRLLNERGLLGEMVTRLDYKQKIDIGHAVPFVTGLMDIGDDLPDDKSAFSRPGSDEHAADIILWYLRQEQDVVRRAAILKDAIRATTGLYLAVDRVWDESRDQTKREENPDSFLVEEDHAKELRDLVIQKIRDAAEDGRLIRNRRLKPILSVWTDWDSEHAKDWVRESLTSEQGFLAILAALTYEREAQSIEECLPRKHWQANLEGIERFVSLDTIEARLGEIDETHVPPEQAPAVRAFRRALLRRRQGRPDDGWPIDDDE